MSTTSTKQAFLEKAIAGLKKAHAVTESDDHRTVLEHLLYAVCREGVTTPEADAAFDRLRKHFFDWNEVRVSTVHEVEETLGKLPDAGEKARALVGVLQQIFEQTFTFDLQDLDKKGLKKAATQLSRFKGVNDYALAWVIQKALGGHAVPLDQPSMRVLGRLGVLDPTDNPEDVRGSVEHMVPKAKGTAFVELVSQHARKMCTETAPSCHECPLRKECPEGQERIRAEAAATKATKAKPR